jgi:hypothetical protein
MALTAEQLRGLDVVLNEAVLIDAQLERERARLGITFYVELLPDVGERDPRELYLQVVLERVTRLAAVFRCATGWDDAAAPLEPLAPQDLRGVVRSMRHHDALYGRRFFDVPDHDGLVDWNGALSLDLRLGEPAAGEHDLTLWTEELLARDGTGRRPLLDLRVWFGDLALRDRGGRPVEIDVAIAAAQRYWDLVTRRGSGGPSPYPVPFAEIGSAGDDQPAAEQLRGGSGQADGGEG